MPIFLSDVISLSFAAEFASGSRCAARTRAAARTRKDAGLFFAEDVAFITLASLFVARPLPPLLLFRLAAMPAAFAFRRFYVFAAILLPPFLSSR